SLLCCRGIVDHASLFFIHQHHPQSNTGVDVKGAPVNVSIYRKMEQGHQVKVKSPALDADCLIRRYPASEDRVLVIAWILAFQHLITETSPQIYKRIQLSPVGQSSRWPDLKL